MHLTNFVFLFFNILQHANNKPSDVLKYDVHCHRQMQLRYHLSFVLATTSVPNSIVNNVDFLEYIGLLDNKHQVPCLVTANGDIEVLYDSGVRTLKIWIGNLIYNFYIIINYIIFSIN